MDFRSIQPLDADELGRIERAILRFEEGTGSLLYRTWGQLEPSRQCRFIPAGSVSPDGLLIRITGIRAFCEGLIRFEYDGLDRYLVGFASGERIPCSSVPFGNG